MYLQYLCVFGLCSPDLIPAFKDVTLDSIKAAGVGPSPAASAPPPPAAAAPAPPAAPGSSYPTHMKVGVFLYKQSTVTCAAMSHRGCLWSLTGSLDVLCFVIRLPPKVVDIGLFQ